MPSILQPWVEQLGLRHQGVLMSAVRGCDSVPKEDPTKKLARIFRGLVLVSFDPRPSSFIERDVPDEEVAARMDAILRNCDHYPVHYITHLMHAAQIVGCKHPDVVVRSRWRQFYRRLCNGFHLYEEMEAQMDARLNADEATHAANFSYCKHK